MTVSRRRFGALALAAVPASVLCGVAAETSNGKVEAMGGSEASPGSDDGILVPEHFVPTPRSVSPQAQAFLARHAPVGGMQAPRTRDDLAGWRAYREASNAGILARSRTYTDRFPSTVITHELSQAKLYEITPKGLIKENEDRAILLIHGGGWITGGGEAAKSSAMQMAGLAQVRVFSVDYRLVPEFAFPAPVEDALEAYRFVLKSYNPGKIALFGSSAGASIAPGAILIARDRGLPLPGACALHSCPSEFTFLGDSLRANFMVDTVLQQFELVRVLAENCPSSEHLAQIAA